MFATQITIEQLLELLLIATTHKHKKEYSSKHSVSCMIMKVSHGISCGASMQKSSKNPHI